MSSYSYGNLSTSGSLPPYVSTNCIKQISEKFYGDLLRNGDGPNNYQLFHSIDLVTDASNVAACVPALQTPDGAGYILSNYTTETIPGNLAKITLTYSVLSAYSPDPTGNEQTSTKQVSITEWSKFTDASLGAGTGASPLNGAIFDINPDTGIVDANSPFLKWGPGSPYIGNDTFEVASILYTYTEYSTSEFSSDSALVGTIQTPDAAPSLGSGGNWLLIGSNRGKNGYFYSLANTYQSSVPGWNTTIYGT
jgi:hypothetical protein